MTSEVIAVEGVTAVIRVEVLSGDPVRQEYRDPWVARFADDGRPLITDDCVCNVHGIVRDHGMATRIWQVLPQG